ncbi:MAG: four helix bundle protein [Nanoarchaeota archaeon]
MKKIGDFTDLIVWQKAHQLVLMIYKITRNFPSREKFALVIQMQRAAVSITSNISEGFARRSKKEKLQFYYMALGSLSELRNQLIICKDLNYLDLETVRELEEQAIEVRKLLNGLIKSSTDY